MTSTDPDDDLAPPDHALIARGRAAVVQVVTLFVGVEIIVIGHYWLAIGLAKAPQQLGRFTIALLLSWALWRGYKWARWVVIGLAVMGIWVAVPVLFAILDGRGTFGHAYLAVMLFCYVVIAQLLLWHPLVPVFLAAQRLARGAAI